MSEYRQETNYTRIARNSVFLYFRMILTLLIGLYTSRVLLEALGAQDYGIYNVVGGFVALFSVVSSALVGAISRFITFELGKGEIETLRRTLSNAIIVLIVISAVVALLGETLGLWFFYHKLVIPPDRLEAAFWVFQLAILAFIINLMATPFNACIIAHEKMDTFAYISILEVIAKLIICLLIVKSSLDKLILFSSLLCVVSVIVFLIYFLYCKRNFSECRGRLEFDRKTTKNMFSYAGWSFIGSSSWIIRGQGGTVLLNIFGGPIVNAANAIAVSLSSAVSNFASCITNAFTPQITKTYASGNYKDLDRLLNYGPKISFYMLFIIALPVVLNTGFVLQLWLGIVPEHSVEFVRLILLMSLLEVISVPLVTVKNATGNIRNYQIVVGGIQILGVPFAYVLLKLGCEVEWLYIAYIITAIACLCARLIMLRGDIPCWSVKQFILKVCFNVAMVSIIASIIPYIIHISLPMGWNHFFFTCVASIACSLLTIYFIGFNKDERRVMINKIKSLRKKNAQIE